MQPPLHRYCFVLVLVDFIPCWVYEMTIETGKYERGANFLHVQHDSELCNVSKDDGFIFKMKHLINEMNNNDYDYIVSDGPVVPMLDYIQRIWNTSNIMVIFTLIPFQP